MIGIQASQKATSEVKHISSFLSVPDINSLLTHGLNPKFKIRKDLLSSICLAEISKGSFVIIALKKLIGSQHWFDLIDSANSKGLMFEGAYSCETDVFNVIIQQFGQESRTNKRAAEEKSDAEINKIVTGSDQVIWFKNLINMCINLGASDVHIEVRSKISTIKIRRDGIIREVTHYPSEICISGLAASFTMLADDRSRSDAAFNLNIAQSAMIPMVLNKRKLSLRYQSHPAVDGFDVVIRILKTDANFSTNKSISLESLGYVGDQIELLSSAIMSPIGGIFIAGITGSGKTTTLSSMLSILANDSTRKIISIEDPVEYIVPGVTHLSIQRSLSGVTESSGDQAFKNAMMAFLRMDPDVGMFGEIRDKISGEMAYTAIQTGHKLLTTVHATSALGIVSRLCSRDIGLPRLDICNPDFFNLLIYQTLVPVNCPHCKIKSKKVLNAKMLINFERRFDLDIENMYSASADGCDQCCPKGIKLNENGHNGVKGMKVCAEVIKPDKVLLEILSHHEDLKAIDHVRSLRSESFNTSKLTGKSAFGHGLFDVSNGVLDPYFFEHIFGSADTLY